MRDLTSGQTHKGTNIQTHRQTNILAKMQILVSYTLHPQLPQTPTHTQTHILLHKETDISPDTRQRTKWNFAGSAQGITGQAIRGYDNTENTDEVNWGEDKRDLPRPQIKIMCPPGGSALWGCWYAGVTIINHHHMVITIIFIKVHCCVPLLCYFRRWHFSVSINWVIINLDTSGPFY